MYFGLLCRMVMEILTVMTRGGAMAVFLLQYYKRFA